jgi:uncharacterized membrane protein
MRLLVVLLSIINLVDFAYFNFPLIHFLNRYNTYQYAISFITIIMYCLLHFYHALDNVSNEDLLMSFNFWLSCGYLIYFLGAFVFVLYYDGATSRQRGNMWGAQNAILTFSSLVTLIGLLKARKDYSNAQ